ncbi:hypothetical protein SAY86_025288 [Trapa natans]|uniref:Uncharacterized protein n=1 Tax=Trapa natans TaxID=22666 RepID=A0AAN7RKL2_TRANT|nr:hypothetical protein SAY86_025288 [Trapa natans]
MEIRQARHFSTELENDEAESCDTATAAAASLPHFSVIRSPAEDRQLRWRLYEGKQNHRSRTIELRPDGESLKCKRTSSLFYKTVDD